MVTRKMKNLFVILASCCTVLTVTEAAAQRGGDNSQLPWAENVTVDGQLQDWGHGLPGLHKEQQVQYALANDAEFVYVALRIEDYDRQVQALTRGVAFMVNTQGRKRDGQTIIFPVADRIGLRARIQSDEADRESDLRLAALSSVRSIQVRRLEMIPDGPIALTNDFGIDAAASIAEDDALCIEMRLPLRFLGNQKELLGQDLAYHVKINGVRVGTSGPRAGVSPYSRASVAPVGPGRVREERGLWGRMVLAEGPIAKQQKQDF